MSYLVLILLTAVSVVYMWASIKLWVNIIGKCSMTKDEIVALVSWLHPHYVRRLKPLGILILNGQTIPVNIIGKNAESSF